MTSLHSARYARFLKRLRQARSDSGLTQTQVAAALHRPQSWVSKSERGERRVDVLELHDLAALYRRPLEWFVPGR